MLFINFTAEGAGFFKSRYREAAEQYRQQGLRFLVGDAKSTKGSFQYFGVKEGQVPLIIVQRNDGKKFLKPNLEPDHISTWLKACKEENIVPYFKSEPISEDNNEPVKVVVGDSIQDIVFNSGKNVIFCWSFILPGVLSYQSDADVIIAKLDGIANYIPRETFEVISYPTVYFTSASGKISQYDGNRTKEDIIEFIEKNRDKPAQQEQGKNEL
uniref:protein disulfide-isomerase n=1 Tax=Glycine max TaxID=3847 RepID=A0A0R0KCB6_SOYBN